MPQVDLETLVCGGGGSDRKIACETLIVEDSTASDKPYLQENPPDFPAESFYLPKEDELDWFDRNVFYERKESTKGNSNSLSTCVSNVSSVSTSQRFSLNLKSKASIIGLPKTQKTSYVDVKFRRNCKPANARFFPKRSRSSGKSTVPVTEPTSPKVSCIGRVKSKRERKRRLRLRRRSKDKSTVTVDRSEKTGFWTSFKAALRLGCRKTQAVNMDERSAESPPRMSTMSEQYRISVSEAESETPSLGGLKRFASGRKSDAWIGCNVEPDIAETEIDSDNRGLVWHRRGMGQPKAVDCVREWESVGPASV